MPEIVTRWFGAFVVENGKVTKPFPAPDDDRALAERLALRRDGHLTPEEQRLLAEFPSAQLTSGDRRFAPFGVALAHHLEPELRPEEFGVAPGRLRTILLGAAESGLKAGWDPTIHVQEAVRSLGELEEIENRIGERLESWSSRNGGAVVEEERADSANHESDRPDPATIEPALAIGLQRLAALRKSTQETRREIERGLEQALPLRAPNLSSLLGPMLAARLIAQAGGLDRLSRLPASTVQVLGAERAFFEHLRGRAPPPRHGLLFLHPRLHSAPRSQRGRLARSLAGKVSIAARLDRAGTPLRAELLEEFERRAETIRTAPGPRTGRGRRPLATPLDRTSHNR